MDLCTQIIVGQLTRAGASALAALGLGELHAGLPFGSRWIAALLFLTAHAMIAPDRTGKT